MLIFRVVNVKRVCSCEGENTVIRVPGCMKDFVAEVKNIDGYLVLLAFVAVSNAARFQRLSWFGDVSRSLERDVSLRLTIKQSEVIVIRPGQQH